MFKSKKYYINSEKGFALVLALIACLILLALGALVINLSTGDIKTSAQILGNKRAMLAADKGVHRLLQNFNADNIPTTVQTTLAEDLAVDPHSTYEISAPVGTGVIHPTGSSQDWTLSTYNVDVTGANTSYNSRVTIGIGIGYLGDASLPYK